MKNKFLDKELEKLFEEVSTNFCINVEGLEKIKHLIGLQMLLTSDHKYKDVGDVVTLIDGSSLVDEAGKNYYVVDKKIKDKKFIVIETGSWTAKIHGHSWINDIKVHSMNGKKLVLYTNHDRANLLDFVPVTLSSCERG